MAKNGPLVLYMSKTCPACRDVIPLIKRLTNKHSVSLTIQEVEKCDADDLFCKGLEWVPTLAQDNKEIPLEKAVSTIERMGKK